MTAPSEADAQDLSLLRTKLYIPPLRPRLVPRPRLIERLNAGLRLGHKLTLVSAPAGFGKTTLLGEWVHDLSQTSSPEHRSIAWLSLDENDDDPVRFTFYLLAALRTIGLDVQDVANALQAPHTPRAASARIESALTDLLNEIAAHAEPFVLVLDDYHLIQAPPVHNALLFLLDHLPPQVHLVIATRADPPVPLSRLRARGQVTEIRQDALKFSPEEATAFMTQSMDLQLTASDMAALGARTEGWIAGLQLAALSLQDTDQENVAPFIAAFSGRYHFVIDYLTDEVLNRQPASMQRFLLRTSVLDRMCGSLCDAILGERPEGQDPNSQIILKRLEHANLFLVPLDNERKWYRYHRLFTDLLRARLQETEPDLVPELHRRAAAWYDEHRLIAEAVHHALAAAEYDQAADMIEHVLQNLRTWSHMNTASLRRWLDTLPEQVLHTRPRLKLIASRVFYIAGQGETTERMLQELERALGDATDPDARRTLGLITADRASYAAVQGKVRRAIELAQQAASHLGKGSLTAQMRVASTLGLAHFRAGNVKESAQAFAQAIAAASKAGIAFTATPLACNLADVQIVQGQLCVALETCQRAMQMSIVDGKPTATTGYVNIELGKILYEQNQVSTAARSIMEGMERLEQAGTPDSFGTLHAELARVRQAQGKAREALVVIQEAVRIAQRSHIPRQVHLISAHRARIWLAQGELAHATRWAAAYRRLGDTQYLREFEDLTLVRVLLANAQPAEALTRLRALQPPAETAGRMGSVLEMLVLCALALRALADPGEALDALKQALKLAEPEGYVRVFVNEGEPMARLLYQVAACDTAPHKAYAGKLLPAFDVRLSGPRATDRIATQLNLESRSILAQHTEIRGELAGPETCQPETLFEPLTDREQEVLRCLAERLTNPEIAQQLFISLPTVKSHTRNIYGKLGVHSRKHAVARARVLGILPHTF